MPDSDSIRSAVVSTINKVRTDSGRASMDIDDSHTLMGDVSLDSLDLAQLVVALEQQLGCDPFRDGSATARTVGELVAVYQKALG